MRYINPLLTLTLTLTICGHITISMSWGNMAYYVKLSGDRRLVALFE